MSDLEERIVQLRANGVNIVDERQVFLDHSVDLSRIYPGATLHPGTRLHGTKTLVGPNCVVGSEGPAVLIDTVLAHSAEVASGYLNNAVLLKGAKAGANAHFREWTLLEEEASTAHAVGLKQTILMSFVTFGSLINFCDGLVAGGRSRTEHTEVGSGFIHFNFSPWGASGDKATPSIIGSVAEGVFLDSDRVFLGGLSGLVGPQTVEFGSLTGAGSVIRDSVPAGQFYSSGTERRSKSIDLDEVKISERKVELNRQYISSLFQLQCWYRDVRSRVNADAVTNLVYQQVLVALDGAVAERVKRLNAYTKSVGRSVSPNFAAAPECPSIPELQAETDDHVAWTRSLPNTSRQVLREWMAECGRSVWVGAE